jgi:hypothetical protein
MNFNDLGSMYFGEKYLTELKELNHFLFQL